ncbi:hypothetical protein NADFUDRAFT_47648 [Nadsonia fulvescens var. elongata DSM 6958]|uniref:mitochondrial processing peptidase n=1 Tax=Nadsonia fulvescens var. elongata DSM 6958 TaxID=857566 RepID=A0A1E3PEH9_9ASCO|nr:hypothetical protein NADFUDRAFT_47648 [Nadsonia fulvescens var. elongata DSM 6958]
MLRLTARQSKTISSVARRNLVSFSGAKTKTTTLPNGFTVASETIPGASTATVGVWVDSGSRAENAYNNGTANVFEHIAFKGTQSRSQQKLIQDIEAVGGEFSAYTNLENSAFYAKSLKEDVPKTVELISDMLKNTKIDNSTIEAERSSLLAQAEAVEANYKQTVFDHLHATAFQQQGLGRTIIGPADNVVSITETEVSKYVSGAIKADKLVLVGAGNVEHEQLVTLAQKHFAGLPASTPASQFGTTKASSEDANQYKKPVFIGSEVRLRDDTMPVAYIAIAVEGVSKSSPDYFTAQVAAAVIGNWSAKSSSALFQGSKLAALAAQEKFALSFESFSKSYTDTGLWGIYFTTNVVDRIDDVSHFALKEWNKLSTSVSQADVERAKAAVKAQLILSLDSADAVAKDIGESIVNTGRRVTAEEIERSVEKVTDAQVRAWAQKNLYDQDIAISALGPIEGLLDYLRIRNDMSMMRW